MPTIAQRQIVTVRYPVSAHPHPAVVLSVEEGNDDWVVCVMISSVDWNDEFSFPLAADMIEPPMSKRSEVRLHLVGGFPPESVIPDRQRMRPAAFKRLLKEVNRAVFGVEQ
ncbi:MAG: hypothetical protein RBT71_09510 [Flavobacteriales bacterium]|jgi:hypothetical protein|nr:hypothetical protein [Flavobacteriales bacterium]